MKFVQKNCFRLSFQVIVAVLLACLFVACGKTDDDKDQERRIVGSWYARGTDGQPLKFIPFYTFVDNNRGLSFFAQESVDSFSYEIQREQLRLFYDKSPSYHIGYDKYNRKSLFRIEAFDDDVVSVVQFFSDGYQSDYDLVRTTFDPLPEEDY